MMQPGRFRLVTLGTWAYTDTVGRLKYLTLSWLLSTGYGGQCRYRVTLTSYLLYF